MADLSLHYSSRAPLAGTYTAFARGVAATVGLWRQRLHERGELAKLDHRTVRDLGLSPGEVQFEASKPFWRA